MSFNGETNTTYLQRNRMFAAEQKKKSLVNNWIFNS